MRDIKDLIAEVYGVVWANDTQIKNLERLVELARVDEREACAKVCEQGEFMTFGCVAEAIRARAHVYANDTLSERVDIKGENKHD